MKSILGRLRWVAIGAAVSALLAGGIGVADAALDSGNRPVLVTITPCRLVDTRPATQVGPVKTPLGEQKYMTVNARGRQGNCNIPADASGLSLNVTATDATELTNLRIYPADAPVPLASNLNPSPNQTISWNAVTTDLSGKGQFRIFNWTGTVNVIVDVAGYYVDHNHDDRYYTKAQSQAGLATKANAADVYTKAQVNQIANTKADKTTMNAALAAKANAADVYTKAQTYDIAGTNQAIADVAAERTIYFDNELDERVVASGRIVGSNDSFVGSVGLNVTFTATPGEYQVSMVANAACLVGNPIVTATAVNNTPVVVTVTNEVPCAQVGNDLRYGVTLRAFTPAGAAVDPTAVMFSAIGTG